MRSQSPAKRRARLCIPPFAVDWPRFREEDKGIPPTLQKRRIEDKGALDDLFIDSPPTLYRDHIRARPATSHAARDQTPTPGVCWYQKSDSSRRQVILAVPRPMTKDDLLNHKRRADSGFIIVTQEAKDVALLLKKGDDI